MNNFILRTMILSLGFGSLHCASQRTDAQEFRFEVAMQHDGLVRTYAVNLPPSYYDQDDQLLPLVIALHGTGGSGRQMEEMYGLTRKASEGGFVIVYPEGVVSPGRLALRSWNAGKCCHFAMENHVDDIGFINAVIEAMISDFKIDPRRVYVTGMSNGGMMAYRLACELSGKIAAIAAVSSTMMIDHCEPERPMPVLHIHSILDAKVPYLGGTGIGGYDFPPVECGLALMARHAECAPSTIESDHGKYRFTQWIDFEGDVDIECYVTYDGGHSWPGGTTAGAWTDAPSQYLNANDLIWDFFQRFQLP